MGSGLSAAADQYLTEIASFDYNTDLPGFPEPTVAGHAGKLAIGTVHGAPVIFLKGRQHFYEGKGFDGMRTMIHTMKALGIENLVITNAAGGLRSAFNTASTDPQSQADIMKAFNVGGLVCIEDHALFNIPNPLHGPNDDQIGPRFLPQGNAWNAELRALMAQVAQEQGIKLDSGKLVQFSGPTYETPMEVQIAQMLGGDLAGMSTGTDNIIANHCGLRCVGISVVTNPGAGLSPIELDHAEVEKVGKQAGPVLARLICAFVKRADDLPHPNIIFVEPLTPAG
jgi:xanthosine phosphorylase